MRSRRLFYVVAGCFFLSGAAGLLYEVVWLRLLGLSFGHTTWAVTTVLSAFMGGLALGSLALGRLADRLRSPVRVYAMLEAAVGVYCLATPLLFKGADALYLSLHVALQPSPVAASVIQFLLAFALMLPPTTLMGATLPVLARAVVDVPERTGVQVGTLYGINTAGAVVGTAATGYLLLPTIGLRHTVWLGVTFNLAAAALAIVAVRALRSRDGEAHAPRADAPAAPPPRAPVTGAAWWAALVAIGVSGAASMAYEIAWTRALSLVLGSSTYAFTAMLTTFLTGLAAGAVIVARLLRRFPLGLVAFGVVEAAIAIVTVAVLPAFGELPVIVLRILGAAGISHRGAVLSQFAGSFLVMIVPTLLIGATLPLVIHALHRGVSRLGRDVGTVYGANTIGTIAGSMIAGFVLIPALGIQRGVIAAAGANLVAAAAVLLLAPEARRARWAAPAALAVFAMTVVAVPPWDRKMATAAVSVYAARLVGDPRTTRERLQAAIDGRKQLFYEEGINTTVTVNRDQDLLTLTVNGKVDASNGLDMTTQLMLGHLPALLAPDARRALVIGLASGVTVGALAAHPVEQIDVAELEPAMIRAATFFEAENRAVLRDPRVKVIAGDGRHVVAAASRPYDIIVSEPSNPWIAGVANLFTAEFYASAKRHLAPGGVMVQWLQGYGLFPEDAQMVVRTFREAFPHVAMWRAVKNDYLLVGAVDPIEIDFDALRRRFAASPQLRQDFSTFGGGVPEDLVDHFVFSDAGAARCTSGARRNTDDLPLLEFGAPLAMYADTTAASDLLFLGTCRDPFPPARGLDATALTSPAARLRAARAAYLFGELGDAWEQVAALGPIDGVPPESRLDAGRLLLALGRVDEAKAAFEALSRRSPGDETIAAYARASQALARSGGGGGRLVRELGFPPRTLADGWATTARWFSGEAMRANEPAYLAVASDYFEAACRLAPGFPAVLFDLGNTYVEMGRTDAAIRVYTEVIRLDGDMAPAHFNLGVAYQRAGRLTEAASAYAAAARLAPGGNAPATGSPPDGYR